MDQVFQFIQTYSTNPLVVAVIAALLGALLTKAAPWLFTQVQRGSGGLFALLGGRWQDFQFERRYLDELIGQFASLGMLQTNVTIGMRAQTQIANLEQVFVQLALTVGGGALEKEMRPEEVESWLRKRRSEGWRRLLPERFRGEEYPGSELGRAIEQHPRLVIRGDPGSGKTTLMKYLAVTCARTFRNDPREGDRRNLVRERLGWRDRPFPIFISLGRQANVLQWGKDRSLLDACEEEFAHGLKDCPPGFFARRLKRGNCLILLDAFDEIGTRAGRNAMANEVVGLLKEYAHPRHRVVVTTRIVGYEKQLNTRGFAEETIQRLSPKQIRDLVKQRYTAIGINASQNQPPSQANVMRQSYARRADELIVSLQHNPRLKDLAQNPLLLSLIVTVHNAKVRLPDQRHILYRDCVEIFAHEWQRIKKAELFLPSDTPDELVLEQKLILLRAVALTMQQQRGDLSQGQVPVLRREAEALIAAQLPQFIAAQLPVDPTARAQECQKKATEWMEGIKQQSGILEEAGFDSAGEPLVRFSHLTFQEYLCAAALEKEHGVPKQITDNLLKETWEEVLLLFIAMSSAERATELVRNLLATVTPNNARGLFIAARSLADKVTLGESERHRILDDLHHLLRAGAETDRVRACELLTTIGAPQSIPLLVQVAENDAAWSARYAAAQALARMGDPRFEKIEPQMVGVPAGEFVMGTSDDEIARFQEMEDTKKWAKEWLERGWFKSEQPQHRVWLDAFEIGKYPVTNAEYKHFIDETGHSPPNDWEERSYPGGKANHPVVRVTWHDAQAYCQWLSQKTGKAFRLPTEVEWEKAATWDSQSDSKRIWSWGNAFDKTKCNTSESGIGGTTPVGIYTDGASPYGAADMTGNVFEWCADWYDEDYYKNNPPDKNPQGPSSGKFRLLRGGSWCFDQFFARGAYRFYPLDWGYGVGFRCARSFSA